MTAITNGMETVCHANPNLELGLNEMAIAVFPTWIKIVRTYLRKENNHYQHFLTLGLCSLHSSVE